MSTALGSNLVGIYLFGSVLTDDFQPASSDVDFLVVTHRPLSPQETTPLRRMHRRLDRAGGWGRRLEGSYAARARLRPWGIIGRVPSVEGRRLDPEAPNDWTAENMMALRQDGLALSGPTPTSVFPAVSREMLDRALSRYLRILVRRRPRRATAAAEAALNIARCLYSSNVGRPSTKSEAAGWLGRRAGEIQPLLSAALAAHRGRAKPADRRLLRSTLPAFQLGAFRLRRLLRSA